ncbi:hypothetical protein PR002_g27191 [Phytophthora rubi]|uniref:Uncharacterized protein n=2 Tax=Phytophthora rubi TaxID=129364 RepID=A0A6A3HKL3_9STRA|nr:hypothetical protein PR002_g27191 [Phytophthora rubi]
MGSDYQAQQSWQSNGTTFPAPASTDYQNAGGANHGAPLPFSQPYYAMDAERYDPPQGHGQGPGHLGPGRAPGRDHPLGQQHARGARQGHNVFVSRNFES